MSYSQYLEEEFVLSACKGIENGRFLDIGAWHAKQFSNTRALYELGWSGVMIEPSPMPMHGLLEEYGNDRRITLINAVVGTDKHLVRMHVTKDAMTTSDERYVAKWSNANAGYYGTMLAPQITIPELFVHFDAGFQFVNIDTEGSSVELLKALLDTGVRPRCICFEHDRRFAEAFGHLSKAGYRVVYENETNRVIVRDV